MPDPLRQRQLADAEIVWNQRYFRPGIWKTDFVGGREFDRWNTPEGDPETFFELIRPLLPAHFGSPVLICGHDVAEHLMRQRKRPAWARFVSASTVYGFGFSKSPCWAINPHHALLLATAPKPGFDEAELRQCAHAYATIDRDQGVFISSPVG